MSKSMTLGPGDEFAATGGGEAAASGRLGADGEPAVDDGKHAVGLLGPGGGPVPEWDYLDNFHKRYNRALLDKIAVQREKDRLERENADLQAILKQYLDGISVNEDVMTAPNPLLVVNGRVNLNAPLVGRMAEPAIIEGNHMVNTGRAVGMPR